MISVFIVSTDTVDPLFSAFMEHLVVYSRQHCDQGPNRRKPVVAVLETLSGAFMLVGEVREVEMPQDLLPVQHQLYVVRSQEF